MEKRYDALPLFMNFKRLFEVILVQYLISACKIFLTTFWFSVFLRIICSQLSAEEKHHLAEERHLFVNSVITNKFKKKIYRLNFERFTLKFIGELFQ